MPAFRGILSPRLFNSVIGKNRTKMKTKKKKEKKRALAVGEEDGGTGLDLKSCASYRNHPIQPLGNLLLLGGDLSDNIRDGGLGGLRALSDELLLDVLALLPAADLARAAAASKSLYVFATQDPLWRALVLRELGGDFAFSGGSWRRTYLAARGDLSAASSSSAAGGGIRVTGFYSDYLFQSWLCANLEMKPEWLRTDNITRRRGLSAAEFVACFEEPNRPVLLEGCLDDWPAMRKWDRDGLLRICGGAAKFAVGPVEMELASFFRYADAAKEERPLYLFDPKFADKVPQLGADYAPPEQFSEDLFALLGEEERPDYRWIIVGAAGSGSSFHVDPNSTSAWNAVIRGSKKWVMFPPEVAPPGVHPSPDGAEVACPVSIAEWFINFYAACQDCPRRPVECVCRTGEVVFVPNGWWHLVLNLEDSIAITQNYVSRRNLLNVLDFLRRPNAGELVSGTKDRVNLYEKFRSAVEAALPGTIDQLRKKAAEEAAAKAKKTTFWESASDANTGGFKFKFSA
ncbi:transferring glycosyl group transferase [Wolffia australiana]